MLRWLFPSTVRPAAVLYPAAWMVIVLVMSSVPGDLGMDEGWFGALLKRLLPSSTDPLHVPGYAVLALLWCRALRAWPMRAGLSALLGFVIAFAFGLLMEWHQAGIPGRVASASDVGLNAAGALMAAGLYMFAARHLQVRGSRPS